MRAVELANTPCIKDLTWWKEIAEYPVAILEGYGFHQWDKSDPCLMLIHYTWLSNLPNGLELTSINGTKYVFGKDDIDDDHRYGYSAYGIMAKRSY